MRLHTIILSTIILISSGVIITNVSSLSNNRNNVTETNIEATTYTLKEYNGQIALFRNDEKTPIEIYEIFVTSLPKPDIEKINRGITVRSKKELNILLEDYLG